MNLYQEAISLGEQKEFLLGHGKYFHRDPLWGDHDSSRTAGDLYEYAQSFGENSLYMHLSEDIKNVLEDVSISAIDLLNLINYISIYFSYREIGRYSTNWEVSDEIKNLIRKHMTLKKPNEDLSNQKFLLNHLREKFEFDIDCES